MLKAVGYVEVSLDKVITGAHITGVHYDSVLNIDITARREVYPNGYDALDALDNYQKHEDYMNSGIASYLRTYVQGRVLEADSGRKYSVSDVKFDKRGLLEDSSTFVAYLEEVISES